MELPDLADLRREFEDYFVQNMLTNYNRMCGSFNKALK